MLNADQQNIIDRILNTIIRYFRENNETFLKFYKNK